MRTNYLLNTLVKNTTNNTDEIKALLGLPVRTVPNPRGIALAFFLFLTLATLLAAASPAANAAVADPLESINRTSHQFNRSLDKWLVKPIASAYQSVTPRPVRSGVSNFFRNLDDVRVSFNDLAQLKFGQAAADLSRFAINTTLGIGGLLDVAESGFGLEKNRQDFGLTLAHYGVARGPYPVLPLLGPSTLRDAFGLGIDRLVQPVPNIDHVSTRNALLATDTVAFRASVLSFDDLIIGDDYLFIRGAYLQQRDYAKDGEFAEVAFDDF
jgi:phospholipid-binding lipoprotein MlaA